MAHGLKHLLRRLVLVLLFFAFGCAVTETPQTDMKFSNYQTDSYDADIGKVQSKLVTLTVQCNKGNLDSCAKAKVFKTKLRALLND